MIDETRYIPMYSREAPPRRVPLPGEMLAERKAKFASILKYVSARQGWLTSVPGEREVEMQCLPGSTLPDELRAGAEYMLGGETVRLPKYKVVADGETTRILPHAVVEKLVRGPSGELVPLTEGSSRPIAETRTHAGICRVERYVFTIP